MKRILSLITLAYVLLTSCNLELQVYVNNITFATSAKTIDKGESAVLQVKIFPEDATDQTLRWSTSDDSIVTVSQKGEIKGIAPGKAVITVISNDGGFKDNCFVTVRDKHVHVTGLVWASTSQTTDAITISKSDHVALGVSVLPSDATNTKVFWTSSDEKVIVVDSAGRLIPVADGQASVIATTEEGGFTAVCNVTVSENASGISLSETALTLNEYDQKVLVATITPEDATDKSVSWSSSDNTVAVVAYGMVTALKAGTCEITAAHGTYSAKCLVTVTCPVYGIDLNEHSATISLGGYYQLVASVNPERASDKTIEWSSSNHAVAVVSAEGRVSSIGLGETEIIATSVGTPSVIAKCKVKVIATEISISPNPLDIYEKEDPVQLTVTGADPQDVTWTSRDKSIATVDANGNVNGLKAGTTEIYAVCKDSGSMAFCRVNVHSHVKSIDVYYNGRLVEKNETVDVFVKDELAFEVVLQPKETILDKTVSWSSDNKEVLAWWEEEQKFYAKSTGDATVTVTAADGGATASVKVHVGEHVSSVSVNPQSILEGFYVGDTKTVSAVVEPSSASDKSVTWESMDPGIVSVEDQKDGTAVLTAKKQGTVDIIAKSVDGGKEGWCKVTVSSKVDGVTIYEGTTNVTGETRKVRVGTQKTLRAEVTPDTVPDKSVEWKSSDEKVASVNSNGVVEFVGAGKVDISAASVLGGASASTSFDVRSDIKKIILDKSEANMIKGGTIRLSATAEPGDAYNTMMRWESDDEDVASVSQDGVVSAHKSGKAVITVRSTAVSGVSASCTVTVTTPVQSITMSPKVASIAVGEKMTLTATVLPEDADNRKVKWTSSKPEVVTVSDDGEITGAGSGEAVVTAYSDEKSDVKAECTVTVIKEKKPVSSVTFNVTSQQMNVNTTFQIVATVQPEDATSKVLQWTSSNESVATVDDKGLVSAKAEGSTNIVALATDGSGKSATCSITVVDPSNIKITSLSFSPVASQYLEKGNTLSIIPVILPQNASNKTLTWISSDEKVATVSDQGVVTPVAEGNVSISARTNDGSDLGAKLDLIVVDRYVPVKGVKIYANGSQVSGNYNLYVGEKQLFEAVLNPSDATNQNVRWEKNVGGRGVAYPNGKFCEVTAGELKDEEESAALNLSVLSQENESYKNTIRIVVIRRPLTGLSFAQPAINVQKGKKTQLTVTFEPDNATDKALIWSYKDEAAGKEIVTLDTATGSVTGKKTGSCVIVATSKRYGFSAECTVTVVNGSDSEHIGFEPWN